MFAIVESKEVIEILPELEGMMNNTDARVRKRNSEARRNWEEACEESRKLAERAARNSFYQRKKSYEKHLRSLKSYFLFIFYPKYTEEEIKELVKEKYGSPYYDFDYMTMKESVWFPMKPEPEMLPDFGWFRKLEDAASLGKTMALSPLDITQLKTYGVYHKLKNVIESQEEI